MTRVLPEPGPATMRTGPSTASTASSWAGFRPSRWLTEPSSGIRHYMEDCPTPRGERAGFGTANVGVIGAGILGLTAALRFVQAGHRVTVIEREERVGGLVASFEIGGSHLERFYHHLFRSVLDVQRLIAEVGLGDDLVWPQPDTSVLYGGRIYGLDSAVDVLRFSPLSLVGRLRLGLGSAY